MGKYSKYLFVFPTVFDKMGRYECTKALRSLTSDRLLADDPGVAMDLDKRIKRVKHRLSCLDAGMI